MFGRNNKSKTEPSLADGVFPPVDFDSIRRQLRLEARGLENGRAGYPESSAADFDRVEREVVATVEAVRRQGLKEAVEVDRVHRERIADGDNIGPGFQQIANKTETDFRREVNARRSLLKDARDDLNGSEAGLTQFKQDNDLNREAYETWGLGKWAALCSVIILAESALNGVFFADANIAGLAGGTITALVISIVNVGAASIAGHACRQKNHVKLLRRFTGWLSLIVGIGLAAFINFLVGHFRDLTATVAWDEAAGAAFGRVVAGHVQMQSLDAWLLTGLGLLIAVIAGWKAYGALDPYPDYSRVSDNFGKKRREWQDLREETFDALTETHDKATADLKDEWDKLRNRFDVAGSARDGLLALAVRRRDFLRECDRAVDDLLAVYRDANRKARATPEPAYFQRAFGFPAEEEPVDPTPLNPEAVQQATVLVDEAVERIHRTCQKAMDALDAGRNSCA